MSEEFTRINERLDYIDERLAAVERQLRRLQVPRGRYLELQIKPLTPAEFCKLGELELEAQQKSSKRHAQSHH